MSSTALQKGDLVLITGGTGWVGSHIVDQALGQGLRVRLATRDENKAKALIEGLKGKHGASAHIETVSVPDFGKPGAYDQAVQGVQGVIHAASVLSDSDKWDQVVTPSVNGYKTLLDSIHAQGKAIRRVVLTSSSWSLGMPQLDANQPTQHFTKDTWNEASVEKAKNGGNHLEMYAASKVLSEQYAWSFVKEHKPHFILNTVLPNMCLGQRVPGTEYSSTGRMLFNLLTKGEQRLADKWQPQYHVDVDDVGLLHVLGATQEDIQNERILALTDPFNAEVLLRIGEEVAPNTIKKFQFNENTGGKDHTTVDIVRTQEILRSHGGLKSLQHSVQGNLQV